NVRDVSGVILGTAVASLPPAFSDEWLFWDFPSGLALSGTTQYIFTSFLETAFVQPVAGGVVADSSGSYTGGVGYTAITPATNGGAVDDLQNFADWSVQVSNPPWDFNFRIQQRNPACT